MSRLKLDKIDLTILHDLQEEGRITNVELARRAGIELPDGHPAEQLRFIQERLRDGDERAVAVFESIGVYLGYALAQYAGMYAFEHVLILGRVTSNRGGELILEKARDVLRLEFPDMAEKLSLHLPDERTKRVGQAVAAASLPEISP